MAIRIVDVTDEASFALLPPCADPGFDHRSCDYWENADRGSKAARASWLERSPAAASRRRPRPPCQPVRAGHAARRRSTRSPRRRSRRPSTRSPMTTRRRSTTRSRRGASRGPASRRTRRRKLRLLGRGLAVFGSYAKVLLDDDRPAVYAQFGPLSAYPRALRTRELYPRLPDSPLPAVITCIASTAEARGRGLAAMLVGAVCDDLASRGFRRRRDLPGGRGEAERDERGPAGVLGAPRVRGRGTRRSFPGDAPGAGVRSTTPRVLVIALVLAGCGSAPVTPSPAVVPTASGPSSPAPGRIEPAADAAALSSSSPDPAASVALDESLLGVLPPDVGGVPIRLEPDASPRPSRTPTSRATSRPRRSPSPSTRATSPRASSRDSGPGLHGRAVPRLARHVQRGRVRAGGRRGRQRAGGPRRPDRLHRHLRRRPPRVPRVPARARRHRVPPVGRPAAVRGAADGRPSPLSRAAAWASTTPCTRSRRRLIVARSRTPTSAPRRSDHGRCSSWMRRSRSRPAGVGTTRRARRCRGLSS